MQQRKLKRWLDVFQNDEEQAFFIALARDARAWLSVYAIARKSGLDEIRVEKLIAKYASLLVQHPVDLRFAYWERVLIDLKLPPALTIREKDQQRRIDEYIRNGYR